MSKTALVSRRPQQDRTIQDGCGAQPGKRKRFCLSFLQLPMTQGYASFRLPSLQAMCVPHLILIHSLSLRRQDHHAGSHLSQVLVLTAQGKAGLVIACVKVIGPGDRCHSIGEYAGCHVSVRNIGIQAREPLSSDRRTLLDSTMQGMKSKTCRRCAEGS